MATLTISLDAHQERAIRDALKRLSLAAHDLTPAYQDIGEHLRRSTEGRFRDQRGPDEQKWKPVSAARKAVKKNPKTLTESGRLRDSITWLATAGAVEVGTNVLYGAIHQLGGLTAAHTIRPKRAKALAWPGGRHPVASVRHPGSTVPARPFLGASAPDREEILAILADHLARALEK